MIDMVEIPLIVLPWRPDWRDRKRAPRPMTTYEPKSLRHAQPDSFAKVIDPTQLPLYGSPITRHREDKP